jgi:hypothetical protein
MERLNIVLLNTHITVALTFRGCQPNTRKENAMTSIAERKDVATDGRYRAYSLPIADKDDLRMLVAHLPGFMDTADANERQMVVEVWYCHKPTS